MIYQTYEVELDHGSITSIGGEVLPEKARALLTILTTPGSPALTSAELAERWTSMDRLPPEEAAAFADDIEAARRNLPPLKSAWD